MARIDQPQLQMCISIALETFFKAILYYENTYWQDVTRERLVQAIDGTVELAPDSNWKISELYFNWRAANA